MHGRLVTAEQIKSDGEGGLGRRVEELMRACGERMVKKEYRIRQQEKHNPNVTEEQDIISAYINQSQRTRELPPSRQKPLKLPDSTSPPISNSRLLH